MTVGDIMTTDVITVMMDDTLGQIRELGFWAESREKRAGGWAFWGGKQKMFGPN
jgi:hypothetical protein